MWCRYLLAIDGSDSGQVALEYCARLTADTPSEVRVLHVLELPMNLRSIPLESTDEAHKLVADVVGYLRRLGTSAQGQTCSAREESVASRIVDAAGEWQCSAIILGSRRLRGLGRLSGHGVRERVLRLSELPVITAPTPAYQRAS